MNDKVHKLTTDIVTEDCPKHTKMILERNHTKIINNLNRSFITNRKDYRTAQGRSQDFSMANGGGAAADSARSAEFARGFRGKDLGGGVRGRSPQKIFAKIQVKRPLFYHLNL